MASGAWRWYIEEDLTIPTLWVCELSHLGTDYEGQGIMAHAVPPIREQPIPIGSTSVMSQPFNPNTRYVLLTTDTACHPAYGFDDTLVATTSNIPLWTGTYLYHTVKQNSGERVAVIAYTGSVT